MGIPTEGAEYICGRCIYTNVAAMSHARVIMPDESVGGSGEQLSTLGVHGSPASLSLPATSAAMSHMEAAPQAVNNDISSESNQHSCRLFVEFNASAEHLDESMKAHLRCFDAGALFRLARPAV